MAINKELTASMLQLEVEKGVDNLGRPVLGKLTYKNIKEDVADQNLYDVALALGELQQHTLSAVQRIDTNDLVEGI